MIQYSYMIYMSTFEAYEEHSAATKKKCKASYFATENPSNPKIRTNADLPQSVHATYCPSLPIQIVSAKVEVEFKVDVEQLFLQFQVQFPHQYQL